MGICVFTIIFFIPPLVKIPGLKTKQAGVALVQFSWDRKGASECHRIVTLDRR